MRTRYYFSGQLAFACQAERAEEGGGMGKVCFVLFCFDVVGEFQMEKFCFFGKARSVV